MGFENSLKRAFTTGKRAGFFFVFFSCVMSAVYAQLHAQVIGQGEDFNYSIHLQAVEVPDMQPIHSFAYGVDGNDILIVGGRTDGLHARQPFAAFPLAYNNQNLIVVNPAEGASWSVTLSALPVGVREQLQSTNMNFHQVADTLYIMGGYAFSPSADNHITFPNLTTIHVPELIESIKSGSLNTDAVRQITDQRFANTGGQMGYMNGRLMVVGGNVFTGRYNPMGNPTYTQQYLPKIQFFEIGNGDSGPALISHEVTTDEQHLRRRDYNLVPYMFTDGRPGYLMSAGVFRQDALLPFLYPVEIDDESYFPHENVEQLLSHYHSPKLSFLDKDQHLHMIFFGGLAQYYFENDMLIQDNRVPFVKTISRFTRYASGEFAEYVMPVSMPDLKGTNAEFIANYGITRNETGVFLPEYHAGEGELLLGYIIGGIDTPERNPFTDNRSQFTSASASVYKVILEQETSTSLPVEKPQDMVLNQNYPNPFNPATNITFVLPEASEVRLDVYDSLGRQITTLANGDYPAGYHSLRFDGSNLASGLYIYRLNASGIISSKTMMLLK